MSGRPAGGPLLLLAVISLAGAGCTTDVVNFPLKNQPDAAARDLFPGNCVVKVDEKNYTRCFLCSDPRFDAETTDCEKLVCELISLDAGSGSGLICKLCNWSNHPEPKCQLCSDKSGTLKVNTCLGNDAGNQGGWSQ